MGNEEFIQSQANKDINGLTLQQVVVSVVEEVEVSLQLVVSGNKIKSCEDPELKVL